MIKNRFLKSKFFRKIIYQLSIAYIYHILLTKKMINYQKIIMDNYNLYKNIKKGLYICI